MIVLSEASPQLPLSASSRDISASTEAARLAQCDVYTIPADFERCENAENALAHIPSRANVTDAIWIGFIPPADRYAAIYDAAIRKNIRLPNTLDEHLNAQEFDRAYDRLGNLTPASRVVSTAAEARVAASEIGYPVFLKGVVQSRKSRGWKACVAADADELDVLVGALLSLENRSRGRIAVRQLVSLRHERVSAQGFPLGREFRAILWHGVIVGMGYYWEGDDPLKSLSSNEEREVRALAIEAARRLETPYVAIDIGQTTDGDWIVIESGDAQFSGVSQIPLFGLWHNLRQAADNA